MVAHGGTVEHVVFELFRAVCIRVKEPVAAKPDLLILGYGSPLAAAWVAEGRRTQQERASHLVPWSLNSCTCCCGLPLSEKLSYNGMSYTERTLQLRRTFQNLCSLDRWPMDEWIAGSLLRGFSQAKKSYLCFYFLVKSVVSCPQGNKEAACPTQAD